MSLRRRLAAVLALLAVPAMVAVLVVTLFSDVSGLIIALVLIGIAAACAWFAATHRGLARGVGVVLAALALAGIALALTLGTGGIVALIALAALLGAFGACARYALGAPPREGRRVGPARRPVLIVNNKSGGGKAERNDLAAKAEARGIEVIELTPGSDLRALAEGAVAHGADVLGMAGGDGSQALVASVAAEHGLAHVCIPAGTRNHFALDLGLDRDDVVGALDAYADAVEHVIDLAEVNGRVFVNNASLGAYAEVVQSEAYRDAKLRTWADMAPDVLTRREARPVSYPGPDGATESDAVVVLVSNNPYQLVSLGGAGTRVRMDRGRLGVATVRIATAADAAALATLNATGRLARFPGFHQWEPPALVVDADSPLPVGVDGEALTLDPPLTFRSRPGALRIRISPQASGHSPAARAAHMERATLQRLLNVARGRGEAVTGHPEIEGDLPEPEPAAVEAGAGR
ncbi:MAG TPA: diacylglycerol kinase family protein [Solirubrobacteraceae bacterium]|nr:diacylglycerol kinase family protein [Solirubrobacteraceae bacterium]